MSCELSQQCNLDRFCTAKVEEIKILLLCPIIFQLTFFIDGMKIAKRLSVMEVFGEVEYLSVATKQIRNVLLETAEERIAPALLLIN